MTLSQIRLLSDLPTQSISTELYILFNFMISSRLLILFTMLISGDVDISKEDLAHLKCKWFFQYFWLII